MEFLEIATVLGAAGLAVAAAMAWMSAGHRGTAVISGKEEETSDGSIVMLFEGEELQHASETAAKLYRLAPGRDDWAGIREKLLNRFPAFPDHPDQTYAGQTTLPARDFKDTAALHFSRSGAFTRVSLRDDIACSPDQSRRFSALEQELEHLRRASDTTPHAIWQVDGTGKVAWHNTAYAVLYQKLHKSRPESTKAIFDISDGIDIAEGRQRVSTQQTPEAPKDWYDISAVSVGDITIYHAVDVNAVVKSEIAQRNFVQTLAKTFAQLSIGLAIFDRNGQLALFNPALIDLTQLPADFLSGRPTLLSFFDRLRENRRMPEPKNYNSWRQQIAEVIAAATDGRYQETWTLETGQTFRVKGRPHPDGAIAFLIEDISAEVSLTRNYRAELELGQSLMDHFDEALVVFSSTGVLTFCNLAYRELWGLDPDNSFADVTVNNFVRAWESLCKPQTSWTELTDFVLDFGEKSSWEMRAELLSGDPLTCKVSRIASGATIIQFEKAAVVEAGIPKPLSGSKGV